jgi:hypothetical protein
MKYAFCKVLSAEVAEYDGVTIGEFKPFTAPEPFYVHKVEDVVKEGEIVEHKYHNTEPESPYGDYGPVTHQVIRRTLKVLSIPEQ